MSSSPSAGRSAAGRSLAVGVDREALRHDPASSLGWYNLGVLLEDRGHPDEALPCYERAVRADASLADAHYNLALLYERTGRKQDALRHFAIFKRLAPQR